ncbi:MAG: C2H2-type zinc finger protein [Thermoplasmata archaeon]|nr:C2H2-type zinc finger protein [Thermoplasmata archaeon]
MSHVVSVRAATVAVATLMVLAVMVILIPAALAASAPSHPGAHSSAGMSPVAPVFRTITFTVAGLPAGTTYTVSVVGSFTSNSSQLSNDSPTSTIFTLNATGGGVPYGLYNWSVAPVAGFDHVGPTSGQTNISTASQIVALAWKAGTVQAVTFTETGLPASTSWTVTFGGAPKTASTATIVFNAVNGTYAYTVTPKKGYDNTNGSGSIAVSGATPQQVDFAKAIKASAVLTSAIPVYMTLPYELTWTDSVQNVTPSAANIATKVTLQYSVDKTIIVTKTIPFNAGHPLSGFFNMTLGNLTSKYANGALPEGSYIVKVTLTVQNTSLAVPQPHLTTASAGTQLAAHYPTATFGTPASTPANPANVSQGPVTIAGVYNGSFVNSANVTVTNSTGALVFVQGVFTPQVTANAQEGFSVTVQMLPGTYTTTITVGTPYGHVSVSEKFNVKATNPVVYLNSTAGGVNIPGLGPGGSAALLVVVGLVVGMLVAMLIARSTSMTPAGPAQPWASQAAAPAAGATTMANECSVCHRSFATMDELKEHSKSEHGITM